MTMKPKTARRLTLVACLVLIAAGAFVGFVLVREAQNDRLEAGLRAQGMKAFTSGNSYEAMHMLGRYLRRAPQDSVALKSYAECRVQVEEADGRHIREAIGVYQRYVDLVPSDAEAKLVLLKLYNKAGLFLEARQLARSMRPDDPANAQAEHVDVMVEEATAMLGLARVDGAFDALLARLETLDDGARPRILHVEGLVARHIDPRDYTRELVEGAPDDPRWLIIEAIARARDADEAGQQALVDQVAGVLGIDASSGDITGELTLTDPLLLREAIGALDRMGRFDLSVAAMKVAHESISDLELDRLLARRLAIQHRFKELVHLFDWPDQPIEQVDTMLLVFRTMAELGLDEPKNATPLIAELGSRATRDFRANAWNKALTLATPTGAETVSARVEILREAVEANPSEPVLSHMLAESLTELGRDDEAISLWRATLRWPMAVGWVTPRIRLSERLLATGQDLQALGVAESAVRIAPENALASVVWFEALAQVVRSGVDSPTHPETVLAAVSHVREGVDGAEDAEGLELIRDRLLVAHARLLCGLGRLDEAAEEIDNALASSVRPGEFALHALSALSREHRLGREKAIVASATVSFGATPSVIFEQAIEMASRGEEQAALDLIDASRENDPWNAREWSIARAKLLEATGREQDAAAMWRTLAEKYADDVEVMRLVLESDAAASDWMLIQTTIDRFRTLTQAREGDTSVLVATARAKGLLHGRPTRRERDEAIMLLERAATERQGAVEIRRLLATAHMLNDPSRDVRPDLGAAARDLEAASRLAPKDTSLAFELAQLLQLRREFSQSRDLLQRLAQDASLDTTLRLRAARMLIDQGEEKIALETLVPLADVRTGLTEPNEVFELARAFERLGESARATVQFERLSQMTLTDPGIIAAACASYELSGRRDMLAKMSDRLAKLELPASEDAFYNGMRFELAGRVDDAVRCYRESLVHDASNQRASVALVSLLLQTGRYQDALDQANLAQSGLPDDPRLVVLVEQAKFALAGPDEEDLKSLINAMRANPRTTQLGAALEDIRIARENGKLDDAEALRELVQRYRGVLSVQLFCAARLARIDRMLVVEAVEIAELAMRSFPDSPEPARLATDLNMMLQRWEAMLTCARTWRQRDLTRPVAAELAVAQALMRLNRFEDASEALRPHVRRAMDSLETNVDLGIISVYCQALAGSGRVDQVITVLEPLLARSATVRSKVALPVGATALPDTQGAEAWIESVRAHVPDGAVDEQIAVAGALSTLAQRSEEPDRSRLLRAALKTLHALVGMDEATPSVLESIGKMHHALRELDAAESAYRQALALDPNLVDALNNLAVLTLDTSGDANEAVSLASRAARLAGPGSMIELETLAGAHEVLATGEADAGNTDAAERAFQAAADTYDRMLTIDPDQPGVLWALARASERSGNVERAMKSYERLLASPVSPATLVSAAQNNLAVLLLERRTEQSSFERAMVLAESAASGSTQASFHETLGRAHAALDHREEAIAAFRTALRLRPDMIIALLGLANVLQDGDEAERAEADDLIARVERLIEDGADVHPSTLLVLERLTQRAGVDD
jgi:tetratricopeptide (TPR) repeat protein